MDNFAAFLAPSERGGTQRGVRVHRQFGWHKRPFGRAGCLADADLRRTGSGPPCNSDPRRCWRCRRHGRHARWWHVGQQLLGSRQPSGRHRSAFRLLCAGRRQDSAACSIRRSPGFVRIGKRGCTQGGGRGYRPRVSYALRRRDFFTTLPAGQPAPRRGGSTGAAEPAGTGKEARAARFGAPSRWCSSRVRSRQRAGCSQRAGCPQRAACCEGSVRSGSRRRDMVESRLAHSRVFAMRACIASCTRRA